MISGGHVALVLIKRDWHEIFTIVSEMRMHMAAVAALYLCSPATAVLLPKEVQNEKTPEVEF
jgi:hypothetical protein